jgi:hypothetical protein
MKPGQNELWGKVVVKKILFQHSYKVIEKNNKKTG